jgi:hypothetical protein
MTPTQAEALAYGEREAKRLKDLGLLTPVEYFDAAKWLAVGYLSGLTAGRLETADVFADTVQTLNGESA